ncbi:MAG: hypothetical protein LV481_04930 [Methylacidiphilales bacterium]|nr:hypothetical protein [Candidatus Methylacidiphilales bacterium]
MSLSHPFLEVSAFVLRCCCRPRPGYSDSRILVIRRNRLGDMICTLPFLHALRSHFPQAHIAVACDTSGAPAARACNAVNDVIVLKPGWNRLIPSLGDAIRLQGYDRVIAAKAGFDRRLAVLTRLSNGAMRIGFELQTDRASAYYTHPVAPPKSPHYEHQIDTQLRLLAPLGIDPAPFASSLEMDLPPAAREFAATILSRPPFIPQRRFMLINISSTSPLKFGDDDFLALAGLVLKTTGLAVGFVAAPDDQPKAREFAARLASDRVIAIATPGPLELAALLEHTVILLTPEGGAAHLAAAVGASALVLWFEGPFEKWHSRAKNHLFIRAAPQEKKIPRERVWQELQSCIISAEN